MEPTRVPWESKRSELTFGEEEASSLPITAARGLGPKGWALFPSGPELGLEVGGLGPGTVLVLGGGGALLFWIPPRSGEGLPEGGRAGLDALGS